MCPCIDCGSRPWTAGYRDRIRLWVQQPNALRPRVSQSVWSDSNRVPARGARLGACVGADHAASVGFQSVPDDQDGQWRAWNGLRWLVVPSERVLPTDFAGDGRSHLCEKQDFIYCFTPAPPRS